MSNSKDKKTGSKSTSFNKSKSISDAINDLERSKSSSKQSDLEIDKSTTNIEIDDSNSVAIDEYSLKESNMQGVNLVDIDNTADNVNESSSNVSDVDDIFIVPDNGAVENDMRDIDYNNLEDKKLEEHLLKEESIDFTSKEDLINDAVKDLDNSNFKEDISSVGELELPKPKSKSFNSSDKSFNKSLNGSKKSFDDSKKSKKSIKSIIFKKSTIFGILGIFVGLIFITYGLGNFVNVSDRVIDHVLLGEAGSWSIIIILIGLIIILLDIFFVFYYERTLKNSTIKNKQIQHTFDTLDKIKSIDSDYYGNENESSTSIFKSILEVDDEKESPKDNLNSNFQDEIIVNPSGNLESTTKSTIDLTNISKDTDSNKKDTIFTEEE